MTGLAQRLAPWPSRDAIMAAAAMVGVACLLGASITIVAYPLLVVGLAACVIIAAVILYPSVGAYVLIGVTPSSPAWTVALSSRSCDRMRPSWPWSRPGSWSEE